MIYLLLYVVFSSVFGLCIKWVYNRGSEDIITIGAINYIVAAISIAPWFFVGAEQTGDRMAMITGGTMGIVYFVAFFFVIYCVRVVGVASSSVVSSISLLLPIVVAAMVWNSIPTPLQIAGIGLAVVSLLLIAIKPQAKSVPKDDPDSDHGWMPTFLLFCFFLLCGMSRIAQETFKYESVADQKPTFLLTAFVLASIPSIAVLIFRGKPIVRMEWVVGIIMGLSNFLQTFLILLALDALPGYLVFPLSSAGGIVFTTLVATLMLNEKLRPRAYAGIAIAVVALILLNSESGENDPTANLLNVDAPVAAQHEMKPDFQR